MSFSLPLSIALRENRLAQLDACISTLEFVTLVFLVDALFSTHISNGTVGGVTALFLLLQAANFIAARERRLIVANMQLWRNELETRIVALGGVP